MNNKQIGLIFYIYVSILLICTIAPWSTKQNVGPDGFDFRLDYCLHLGVYFGLTILYFIWQIKLLINLKFSIIYPRILLLLLFCIITEYLQLITPFRSFSYKDFVANAIGVLLALSLLMVFRKTILSLNTKYIIINNK